MARDVIRARQSLFAPSAGGLAAAPWQPPADVYETHDGWLIKLDLAGVRPEDVRLTLCGRRLTISGSRRDTSIEQGCRSYRMEIAYSQFERCVDLPATPDRVVVTSEYRDGMLFIRILPEKRA
jgi:HSP20 family protein